MRKRTIAENGVTDMHDWFDYYESNSESSFKIVELVPDGVRRFNSLSPHMKTRIKIFFLHAKRDYKTEQEKLWLDTIRKHYPEADIINSSDINDKIDNNDRLKGMKYIEEKYFFPIIDVSDIMIVTPSYELKRFTIGVVVEMKYATSKGKKIKLIEGERIKEIDYIEKYEKDIVYHIPGEEPIIINDLIKSKGFKF